MGIKQDIMQTYQTIDTTVCQQEFDIRDDSFSESNELVNNNKRIFREEPDMHHTLIDKSNNASDFNNCVMKSLILVPAAWPVSYQDQEKGFIQFSS